MIHLSLIQVSSGISVQLLELDSLSLYPHLFPGKRKFSNVIKKIFKIFLECFSKFHENSSKIEWDITKNPQQLQWENLQAFHFDCEGTLTCSII